MEEGDRDDGERQAAWYDRGTGMRERDRQPEMRERDRLLGTTGGQR